MPTLRIKVASQIDNQGFTLVELLVSIGVLSLISGIAITIFVTLSASYDKSAVISSVNGEGSRIMEQLARTIRSSTEVQSLSAQSIRLTIPREVDNLEYGANGNCSQVDIFYDAGTRSIRKSSPATAGTCMATPICPQSNPCVLSADEVDVNADFGLTVTSSADSPSAIRVSFTLMQDASLSDPEQQSSQQFQRVILTRGY